MKDLQHELAVVKDAVTDHTVSNIDAHLKKNAGLHNMADLPGVYTLARPILLLIVGFLAFKPSWSNAVHLLVVAMDQTIPQEEEEEQESEEEEETQDVDDDNLENGVAGAQRPIGTIPRGAPKKAVPKKAANKTANKTRK